jgi:hypothetical protein
VTHLEAPGSLLPLALRLAGLAQCLLAVASLAIPRVLGWRAELRAVGPLTRQTFWTYAAYVWGAHVAFGLVSLLRPAWLLEGDGLARAVCAFVAAWWGARLGVAFAGCEGAALPPGRAVAWAERTLRALFAVLTAVYAWAALAAGSP